MARGGVGVGWVGGGEKEATNTPIFQHQPLIQPNQTKPDPTKPNRKKNEMGTLPLHQEQSQRRGGRHQTIPYFQFNLNHQDSLTKPNQKRKLLLGKPTPCYLSLVLTLFKDSWTSYDWVFLSKLAEREQEEEARTTHEHQSCKSLHLFL